VETDPGVHEVRHTVIHITEPLVPESVVSEVNMTTEEQKYTTHNACSYNKTNEMH